MTDLTIGELFAGVGGFSAGFGAAGFVTRWQVEIDPAASGVLARHWPAVKRERDIRTVTALPAMGAAAARMAALMGRALPPSVTPAWPLYLEPVDVITGGFPCQDLSVAGLRGGLAGARSGLFWEFIRIVREMRDATEGRCPAFVVLENVPGLFSSNGGRDFAHVLRGLGDCGVVGAGWAVLDSQWFGLAQRRERVFIVGDFGGSRAGEILALTDSLSGHSPPRRAEREDVATGADDGAPTSGWSVNNDSRAAWDGIAAPLRGGGRAQQAVAGALTTRYGKGVNTTLDDGALVISGAGDVAHTLRAEGFDASEDGTGRGTPIVAVPIDFRQTSRGDLDTNNRVHGSGGPPGVGIGEVGDPAFTVSERGQAVFAFDTTQITSKANRSNPQPGDPCHPLVAYGVAPAIAFTNRGLESGDVGETLPAASHGAIPMAAVAFTERTRAGGRNLETQDDFAYALTDNGAGGQPHSARIMAGMTVRRLMPVECEKLMGLPPGWTECRADGKPQADGPRYRQLGNAVCPPVVAWIAERLGRALAGAVADGGTR